MRTLRVHVAVAVSLTLLAVAATVAPHAAQAVSVKNYMYTGNEFTTATGPFVGSEIVGAFAIDCGSAGGAGDCTSLALDDYSSSITEFQFGAGDAAVSDLDAILAQFVFSTNAGGAVIEWTFGVGNNNALIESCFPIVPGQLCSASAVGDFATAPSGMGSNSGPPGVWFSNNLSVAEVPGPAALPLLLSALAALVLLVRRRGGIAFLAQGRLQGH